MNTTDSASDALVGEHAYFQAVFDAVNDAIFVDDATTGQMIDVNATTCQMYGYTRDELLAMDIGALSEGGPLYNQENALAWLTRARTDGPQVFEWRARHRTGRIFWVEVNVRFARIGSLERFFVTVRDIEARKKAEDALRQSDARIRALLQHVPSVAVQAYRADGVVTYWNAASERIYGYTAAEAIGRNLVDLIIPEGMRELVRQAIRQMADTGEPVPAGELELQRKGGALVPVYSCHAVVPTPGGEPVLFCMDVDLTDTRRAEQERITLERRLFHGQKLESLGLLAGGIAHDFNNLLTAILGNLDLAVHEIPPASSARPCLDDAMSAVRRAADLTRQMLAYSGQGHFVVEDLSLSSLVEENVHMLRTAVPRSIAMNVNLDHSAPAIRADAGQIQQVVMNLIVNASEAIADRAGTITLTTTCRYFDDRELELSRLDVKPPAARYVCLTVTDTGCGMTPETQQRLFDPFFSTKRAGRGLGMSAVMGIVRGHQGAIILDTAPDMGTCVKVLFPVSSGASVEPIMGEVAPQVPVLKSGLVLVVDDEETVLALCRRIVEKLGYQTVTASDGIAGLAAFQAHADTIICSIIDMTMPRMDGVNCVREIRKIRPDARIILSSGFTQADITRRFGDARLSGFVQKPYDLAALRSELTRVLQATPASGA